MSSQAISNCPVHSPSSLLVCVV